MASTPPVNPENNSGTANPDKIELAPDDPPSYAEAVILPADTIVSNAVSIDVISPDKMKQSAILEKESTLDAEKFAVDEVIYKNDNCVKKYFRKKTAGLTRTQLAILTIFPFVEFFAATVISIQGPFYPQVARSKGATPTESGLVFGSFEITVFLMAPIYGAKMGKWNPNRLFNYGIFTTSMTCILFGFVHHIDDRLWFIVTSLLIRTVEAIGDAAFVTASFSIISQKFPDSVATTFAMMETFYGLGMIAGPTVGGALYHAGGFTLPFTVMGGLLLISAFSTYVFITKRADEDETAKLVANSSFDMFKMFRFPVIALTAYGTFAAATGIGFLSNNLEHHLEEFGLNALQIGSIFMLNGGVYAITAPIWGRLCDKTSQPKIYSLIGSLLTVVGFALIGPLPFFPSWNPSILVICIGLIIFGLGLGSTLVSAFIQFLQDAIAQGHQDDVTTHGLVSGLWTSMTALGFFVGPTFGGFLDHHVGFRWGTIFILAEQIILLLLLAWFFYSVYKPRKGPSSSSQSQSPSPSTKKDDLNDVVITYSIKASSPLPEMTENNGIIKNRVNLSNEEKTSLPTTASKEVNAGAVRDDTASKDKQGVENPNFVEDS